ncbi:hypothetical protein PR048_011416 [Dryococelus australis]|uniref:Uncharacterized protein n=1 Tax=Dryococelus australis TaxID=614101 RepID=A0ABQ9HM15_9NEOP|nr:hypothetical protein PR048_011416 [Dryococelus australis]
MSDEEFTDLLISQLPVNYQRQFSDNVYTDVSEFRYHLIRADQFERQTRVTNPPRDYDRPRQNPALPLYQPTNQPEYNNQPRPYHNQNNPPQKNNRNFRVNTYYRQDNGRVNNFAYREEVLSDKDGTGVVTITMGTDMT